MRKRAFQDFYRALAEELYAQCALDENMPKRVMKAILEELGFRVGMEAALEQPVSCMKVLAACIPVMAEICPEPEEGWAEYIYGELLHGVFPEEGRPPRDKEHERAFCFALRCLRRALNEEKAARGFNPFTDMALLTPEECTNSRVTEQYERFLDAMDRLYVLEMFRLSRELRPFDALSHTACVHHMAMHAAKQANMAGIAVDLPLVSAAAAAHDIGKFGCRGVDTRRIPYLHYFYTDQWLRREGAPDIAHISANHSTWDLELENLPVESLLLIYADFRVKSARDETGFERTRIFSLAESYDVILGKLDNVDETKRDRYERVYLKLKDFEDYLVSKGVNTDPWDETPVPAFQAAPALLSPEGAVRALKRLTVEHNLRLMRSISSEESFGDLLEHARGERNRSHIRTYLNIFEEYFTYMTRRQKVMTLRFLYELLMHPEGDIRRKAGRLMGAILANSAAQYRKELPAHAPASAIPPALEESLNERAALFEEYLELILHPDHKISPKHRSRVTGSLKVVAKAVLANCARDGARVYLDPLLARFREENPALEDRFALVDTLFGIELGLLSDEEIAMLIGYCARLLDSGERRLQSCALRFMIRVMDGREGPWNEAALSAAAAIDETADITVIYLLNKALRLAGGTELVKKYSGRLEKQEPSELFLENLKSATPWIMKVTNIDWLTELTRSDAAQAFHVATHLSNLVRVSEHLTVREHAGDALITIAPMLSVDQCNEIAVELTRGLETARYEFSRYIPPCLGRLALFLPHKELDEVLDDFERHIKSANERAACMTLHTLGVLLAHYDTYAQNAGEPAGTVESRRMRAAGLLLLGLTHYAEGVRQEALQVIGRGLFGSEDMGFAKKLRLFKKIHKKLLTLIHEQSGGRLMFFNTAAMLNHLYRFITDANARFGPIKFAPQPDAAFFPGTFDPFSTGHRGIVDEIRNLGMEVYLAVDEFSWSKRTQPKLVRRGIVNMSVADAPDVFLFPDDRPVNLAAPEDLKALRELFANREVYIVTGSDVIENASAYRAAPTPDSIHHFGHIVFARSGGEDEGETGLAKEKVMGRIIRLSLPVYLEDVSSSRIREYIDKDLDISMLVDPLVQEYVYINGLYLRAPQYKTVLRLDTLEYRRHVSLNEHLTGEFARLALDSGLSGGEAAARLNRPGVQAVALYREGEPSPLGGVCFHSTNAAGMYDETRSMDSAQYIRGHTSGRVLVIDGVYAREERFKQMLLNKALADALGEDNTYALYRAQGAEDPARALFKRKGFRDIPGGEDGVMYVDMRFPIVLIEDVAQAVKEPHRSAKKVAEAIERSRSRLERAMTGLYPGTLTLSFDADMLDHELTSEIIRFNGAPGASGGRRLAGNMCVPYGRILSDSVIPNTVTKTLHAEKTYAPDLKSFSITEYPGYSPLSNQVRTLRSFRRPVLLVDDLLHKGYRIEALDPIFREEGVEIRRIFAGILSGRGRDLMRVQGRDAQCVYFIPNLRHWFTESMLYPFIGGDSVDRGARRGGYLPPSVNMVLPYAAPPFICEAERRSIFALSYTALENAYDILQALEQEHQAMFEQSLTLGRLGEALLWPRRPDKGGAMQYDYSLPASSYIRNDMEALLRMKAVIE